jgi:sugar-specific transcriptional regulator TrmB
VFTVTAGVGSVGDGLEDAVPPRQTHNHTLPPEIVAGQQGRPWARRAAVPYPRRGDPPDEELAAVGIDPTDGRLYRALLARPRASTEALAEEAGTDVDRARRGLAALERDGLISRLPGQPGRFFPARPDVAVGALISRRQQELEQARLHADWLLTEFDRGARDEHAARVVEIITDREAIGQRALQLQRNASDEVLMLDKPPHLGSTDNPDQLDSLARGVRWRAVYSTESLEAPGRLDNVRRFREAGEQARVSPQVPVKLAIADRRIALLPLNTDHPSADHTAILVHPSSLLATLIMLFETLWKSGLPIDPAALSATTARSRGQPAPEVIQLLAAGMTDNAIARHLGVSRRTVGRWIAEFMADSGVATRFQLGLAIGQRTGEPPGAAPR